MSKRRIAWIELFGGLAILVPLSGLLVVYGGQAAWLSFRQGERVGGLDLPFEWVLKATVPLGFLLLLLSAASAALRNALFLRGQAEGLAPQGEDASSVVPGADQT